MVTHKATWEEKVYMGSGQGTFGDHMEYSMAGNGPLCQVYATSRRYVGASTIKDEWVTCKRCLKLMVKA